MVPTPASPEGLTATLLMRAMLTLREPLKRALARSAPAAKVAVAASRPQKRATPTVRFVVFAFFIMSFSRLLRLLSTAIHGSRSF